MIKKLAFTLLPLVFLLGIFLGNTIIHIPSDHRVKKLVSNPNQPIDKLNHSSLPVTAKVSNLKINHKKALVPLDASNGKGTTTKIPVILYHRLLTKAEQKPNQHESDILNVQTFAKQMKYLHDKGYHTITVQQLDEFINGQITLPKKSVMIQFDDGRLDILRYAYPIMKKYNLHGEVNLITSRETMKHGPWNPQENMFLQWPEVAQIRDVFELGGHTNAMHNINAQHKTDLVSNKLTYAQKLADLETNRKLIGYGIAFAYPWGQYNTEAINLLKQAGFKLAFTTNFNYIKPHDNPYLLNRFTISPNVGFSEFKGIVSGTWKAASPSQKKHHFSKVKHVS